MEYHCPSSPGILVTFYKPLTSANLSKATFEKWYEEVHLPELIASGAVSGIWRWKAANPGYDKQDMTIFKVPDLAKLDSEEFKSIKRTSEGFPDNGVLEDFYELDSRVYGLAQYYAKEKQPEDAFPIIIMAAMEPAAGPEGEADLDAWYREEHNQQMSEQPGWKRTTRFRRLTQYKNHNPANDAPLYFAIHEFGEGHEIGKDVVPLDPTTEWTKKVTADAQAIDVAVYHKTKSFSKTMES